MELKSLFINNDILGHVWEVQWASTGTISHICVQYNLNLVWGVPARVIRCYTAVFIWPFFSDYFLSCDRLYWAWSCRLHPLIKYILIFLLHWSMGTNLVLALSLFDNSCIFLLIAGISKHRDKNLTIALVPSIFFAGTDMELLGHFSELMTSLFELLSFLTLNIHQLLFHVYHKIWPYRWMGEFCALQAAPCLSLTMYRGRLILCTDVFF